MAAMKSVRSLNALNVRLERIVIDGNKVQAFASELFGGKAGDLVEF